MKDLLVFLADGFEEIEALTVVDLARRAELKVDLVGLGDKKIIKGAHDVGVEVDLNLDELNIKDYRAIFIPGGQPGATNLMNSKKVVECVNIFNESDNIVAAICAGPQVLDKAGILQDGKFTCYPGVEKRLQADSPVDVGVFEDGNIITSMGPSTAVLLGLKLIERLISKEKSDEIAKEILLPKLKEFM